MTTQSTRPLTLREFARAVRRSEPYIRKMARTGRLPTAPGRPYRIAPEFVAAWNRGEIGGAA